MTESTRAGADLLFLDANVLFSAAHQPNARMRRFWSLADAALITSTYAADEARRNLDSGQQRDQLAALLIAMRTVDYEPVLGDTRAAKLGLPAKDEPILLAAVDLGATHLITGDDKHFGHFYGQRIFGVLILPPAAY